MKLIGRYCVLFLHILLLLVILFYLVECVLGVSIGISNMAISVQMHPYNMNFVNYY